MQPPCDSVVGRRVLTALAVAVLRRRHERLSTPVRFRRAAQATSKPSPPACG